MSQTASSVSLVDGASERKRAQPARRLSSTLIAVPIFILLAVALLGCEDPTLGRGIIVRNETGVPLTFQWLLDGEVVNRSTPVPPDDTGLLIGAANLGEHSLVGDDGCTTVPVVALGPDGEEVARAEPPLCVGEEWVVRGP